MQYTYRAKKSLNETIEGVIEAVSLKEAIELVERQGLVPVLVESQSTGLEERAKPARLRLGGWGQRQTALFTQKIYNLVKSQVDLLSSLKLLEEQCVNQSEKMLLEDLVGNIKDGAPFSQCLSRYPQYFSLFYVSVVRVGESSGQLKESLGQLLNYLKRLENLRLKVRQALAYPIFMVLVGAVTIFITLTFIMPRIAVMFEDFQADLPLPTRILLSAGNFLKAHWLKIAVFLVFLSIIMRGRKGAGDSFFARLRHHLPFLRRLSDKEAAANFSTSLALLLRSGITLLSALVITAPIIGRAEYIQKLEGVCQDIKKGVVFSQALAKARIFPLLFIQMIKIGEETGRLDNVLADIADSYQEEIESDLKIISSLLEPAIILVLGLIIGGMVIAILLPIFDINRLVGT